MRLSAFVVGLGLAAAASLACADDLYSNGPFITNPTGGTGTILGLPISNPDPFTIPGQSFTFYTTGVAATVATNTASAEDFTVPAGQGGGPGSGAPDAVPKRPKAGTVQH